MHCIAKHSMAYHGIVLHSALQYKQLSNISPSQEWYEWKAMQCTCKHARATEARHPMRWVGVSAGVSVCTSVKKCTQLTNLLSVGVLRCVCHLHLYTHHILPDREMGLQSTYSNLAEHRLVKSSLVQHRRVILKCPIHHRARDGDIAERERVYFNTVWVSARIYVFVQVSISSSKA